MTPPTDIPALKALREAATPGEWAWYGNARNQDIYLATVARGRQYVMGFQRWGMREAQPSFRVDGRIKPASDLVKFEVGDRSVTGYEAAKVDDSVYRYDICDIDAPDARYIVALHNAAPALMAEVLRLREANDRALAAVGNLLHELVWVNEQLDLMPDDYADALTAARAALTGDPA